MNYKYNEELYAKTIKENGFQTGYIKSELTILVKYLKQIDHLSKKETEEYIYNFCKNYIEGFNEVQYFKVIDNAIRNGRKTDNKLIVIESIPLMNKEIEGIDKLNIDHEYKKLLLSLLINRKISFEIHKLHSDKAELSAYFGGTNKKYREVFALANIVGKHKVNEMITKLVEAGVITSIINGDIIMDFMFDIYDTYDEIIKVKDNITKKVEDKIRKHIIYELDENDIYERITDFENIGYIFDYYKDVNKVKKCEECGKYIKTKSKKPPKYCNNCAKEVDRKKSLERWKKGRASI